MKKILLFVMLFVSGSILIWNTTYASTDISDTSFEIDVDQFTPGGTSLIWGGEQDSETAMNTFLWVVIEKLIIIFWVLATLIMTVGAWYMILYHGQDELLSKWKSIFMAGITAMAIALSAWVIVRLFAYFLYS